MTQVICPKAGECKVCAEFWGRVHDFRHDIEHNFDRDMCIKTVNCPACIPLPDKKEEK